MKRCLALLTVVVALGAPAAAVAATGYASVSGGSGTSSPSSTAGSLPFTGLDLEVVAASGLGLLGLGLVLRRGALRRQAD
jgi:hypothetical protein